MIKIPLEFDADGFPIISLIETTDQDRRWRYVFGDPAKIIEAVEKGEAFAVKIEMPLYNKNNETYTWLRHDEIVATWEYFPYSYFNPGILITVGISQMYKEAWLKGQVDAKIKK